VVYFNAEEDASDAIRKFVMPVDSSNRYTGLYQFKETLYRTHMVDSGGAISISADELRVLVDNFELVYGKDQELSNLLNIGELRKLLKDVEGMDPEDKNEIIRNNFKVSQLEKAVVHFANDICEFWCSKCRRLYFETEVVLDRKYNHYMCPKCRKSLQTSAVWVLRDDNGKSVVTPLPVWVAGKNEARSLAWTAWGSRLHTPCPKCGSGRLSGYRSLSPARLLESSRLVCDSCNEQFRLWGFRRYVLSNATENLTEAFVVTTYNRATVKFRKKEILPSLRDSPDFDSSLVDSFWFAPDAVIKEVVLGYWYGENIRRVYQSRRFGTELKTGCIYLKLKPEYFEKCTAFLRKAYKDHPDYGEKYEKVPPEDKDLHHIVVHSIAHSILTRLPQISGVSIDSFSYYLDLKEDSLLIYERAPGGLGACSELVSVEEKTGAPIALEFFNRLKEDMVRCTCDDRCKYCIATESCREYNDALTRFALGPLLRVDIDREMTWGF
jgi:Zn finger protein HypA/HybF involved in hydrogenase expression